MRCVSVLSLTLEPNTFKQNKRKGHKCSVRVSRTDTISTLKRKISEMWSVGPKEQRLIYNGKPCKVGTMENLGVCDGGM